MIDRRWLTLPLALLCGGVMGCTDKAEPEYKRCEKLESEGKLDEALAACQAAQAADPRSPAGELSTKKQIKLMEAIADRKRKKAAADAAQVDEAKLREAEAQVDWKLVATPPNDKRGHSEKCRESSRDFENVYFCEPKDGSSLPANDPAPLVASCLTISTSKGCKPLHPDASSRLFCCTK